MSTSLKSAKRELRKLIQGRLNATQDIAQQSLNVAQQLENIAEYQTAVRVGYYLHMDEAEIETHDIISAAFKNNKRVFLPRVIQDRMEMIEVESEEAVEKLQPEGKYKLREPALNSGITATEAGGLDLMIVPGLGFTTGCARLGRGKGYYDRYINALPRTPFLVGIGATQQLVNSIPLESHDRLLDKVIISDTIYSRD